MLRARPEVVHWGYFDSALKPAIEIESGDIVSLEAITHQAGDAPHLLMDEQIREIYDAIPYSDRDPGVHLMTGPISVAYAEPGDSIEVRYLSLRPRLPYGTNMSANWGYLYKEFDETERVTIFSVDTTYGYATALYAYEYSRTSDIPGIAIDEAKVNKEETLKGFRIPITPHIGTAGVAMAVPGRVSTIPPGEHGGNIDNWRIGEGAVMYYPVLVPGALLSIGDPHLSQGDGELNGTAVEASLDVTVQIFLHKKTRFPSPLLETKTHWYVHGFDDNLDGAMRDASLNMLEYLVRHHGMSRKDAYVLMSVACNFGVTQVVDRKQGVHVSVPKAVFPSHTTT